MMAWKSQFRATVGACALVAVAASGAAAQETPKNGGVLKFATQGEAASYDCHVGTSIASQQYLAPHYSTLLEFGTVDYPTIRGDLAKEWSVSPDGLTYSFVLHDNVKFHDGSALTADDVKASFERIARPPEGVASVRRAAFGKLDTITVTAPDKVEFKLKSPSAAFIATLASPWNCIYSAKLLASNPDYPAKVIMGSGPFVFEEYQAGAVWKGKKFADYFVAGKPHVDAFEATVVSGESVINSIAGGQLHANFRLISTPQMDRIKQVRGDQVTFQTVPSTSVNMVVINTKKKPFDDPRVRKALSLAFDRYAGVSVLGDQAGQRWPNLIFRHGHPNAPDEAALKAYPGFSGDIEAQREEAKKLLAEAGVSDLKFTFLNRAIKVPYEPLGIFFIDQWRRIGVEVTMEAVETGPWAARLKSGEFDVAIDFNAPSSDDPTEVLARYVPGSPTDYSRIEDAKLVELYQAQDNASDPAERAKLVKEFVDRHVELGGVIPTFNPERTVVFDNKVKGWSVPPPFVVGLNMRDVWLDE
jgi:peptide/nickel transport system substrate-binding protein